MKINSICPVPTATLFSTSGGVNRELEASQTFDSDILAVSPTGHFVGYQRPMQPDRWQPTQFNPFNTEENFELATPGGSIFTDGKATGINRFGQICGTSYSNVVSHAVFFGIDPGIVSAKSTANAINESGQIVGSILPTTGSALHAVLFGNRREDDVDLGTLGGPSSEAFAINRDGVIVGNSDRIQNPAAGFIYREGKMESLSALTDISADGSYITASGINDWGQISATSYYPNEHRYEATLLNPLVPSVRVENGVVNTKFVAGMKVAQTAVETNGLQTEFRLLDGVAGSGGYGTYGYNRQTNLVFENSDKPSHASDIATLTGLSEPGATDTAVVQMSYDRGKAAAFPVVLLGSRKADSDVWEPAVAGNAGGVSLFVGNRPYDRTKDFQPGIYGVDSTNGVVWAVTNHDGEYAAIRMDALPPDQFAVLQGPTQNTPPVLVPAIVPASHPIPPLTPAPVPDVPPAPKPPAPVLDVPPAPVPPAAPAQVFFQIGLTAQPAWKGTVRGAGAYTPGRIITVRAFPRKGQIFRGWFERGRLVTTSAVYRLRIYRARELRAVFR